MDLVASSGTLILPIYLTTWCHIPADYTNCNLNWKRLFQLDITFIPISQIYRTRHVTCFGSFHVKPSSGLALKHKCTNFFVTHTVYRSLIWSMIHIRIFTVQHGLPYNSLARPERKQTNVSVRIAWISFSALQGKNNLMTACVSMLLKSRASLTCFRACFLPGRAKDLSASRYYLQHDTLPQMVNYGKLLPAPSNQISTYYYCNYLRLSTFNRLVHRLVIIRLHWPW